MSEHRYPGQSSIQVVLRHLSPCDDHDEIVRLNFGQVVEPGVHRFRLQDQVKPYRLRHSFWGSCCYGSPDIPGCGIPTVNLPGQVI